MNVQRDPFRCRESHQPKSLAYRSVSSSMLTCRRAVLIPSPSCIEFAESSMVQRTLSNLWTELKYGKHEAPMTTTSPHLFIALEWNSSLCGRHRRRCYTQGDPPRLPQKGSPSAFSTSRLYAQPCFTRRANVKSSLRALFQTLAHHCPPMHPQNRSCIVGNLKSHRMGPTLFLTLAYAQLMLTCANMFSNDNTNMIFDSD